MGRILVPTHRPEDWKTLLADPERHWKRGYSAMAAALSWENAKGLPTEVATILGPDSELLLAIPEHKVAMPGGGRESQCDVFALAKAGGETIAVAIEAKVNETFGPFVGEWLREPTPGKEKRLSSICSLLGASYPVPLDLRYQLFHRSAAAICEAVRFKTDKAAMIVQSFSQSHVWFEDFAAFCLYLGVEATKGTGVPYHLPDGRELVLGWATGSDEYL